jgi:cytidylate kinase
MIIAVDGPAGAGKSTVAKILAQKLGFLYIDTGAMYRALTLSALENNLDLNDTKALVKLARILRINLEKDNNGSLRTFIDGRDVSQLIREPRITQVVSDVAKIKDVREIMVKSQRQMARQNDCVVEGRDIATVVFPGADKKFYIDANFQKRAKRRFRELKNLNVGGISLENVALDLKNRDKIDSTREVAPLKKAQDAIYIDTTNMTIEEVVNAILIKIRNPDDKAQNSK